MRKFIIIPMMCLWVYSSIAQNVENNSANVQTASSGSASETASGDKNFKLSGYFDTYYFFNLNDPANRNNLGNSGVARGFDRYPGSFQLGMFLNRFQYSYKKAEFVGEVGLGPNVEYGSYGNDFRYRWGQVIANSTYSSIMIKQAYINYSVSDKLVKTAGQFGTHIGYEYIDAPLNFHYSINNTFNVGIPFYHVGIKGTLTLGPQLAIMAGVVNGTDNMNDNNRAKSFIGQVSYSPSDAIKLYFNTIQGNEANTSGPSDIRSYFGVLDFVGTFQLSEKFLLGTWAMYGSLDGEYQGGTFTNDTKHWWGVNLYTAYQISGLFSLGMRIEHFDNSSGVRALLTDGEGTTINTATLTGNISLAEGTLTLKPELRVDTCPQRRGPGNENAVEQFIDSDGQFSKNDQITIGLAAIYKF